MAHVAPWKRERVEELTEMLTKNAVVGIVRVDGIPSAQFQQMRALLRGKVRIKMSKNNLLRLAVDAASKEREKLAAFKEVIDGQCAIFATSMNPFKVFNEFSQTERPVPSKGGEIAQEDIVVEKGDTPFKPGPIVSEFQRAGIPAAIDKGKIVIKNSTVICKAGEPIPEMAAPMLNKLEIFPLSVGLNLKLAYEDGTIFSPEVLDVDPETYVNQIRFAALQALNLSVFAGYPTSRSMVPLIVSAYSKAVNLSVNAGVPTQATLPLIIGKVYAQMLAIAARVSADALDDGLHATLSSTAAVAATPPSQEGTGSEQSSSGEPAEEEEEEEATEEEAMAGLGALFG